MAQAIQQRASLTELANDPLVLIQQLRAIDEFTDAESLRVRFMDALESFKNQADRNGYEADQIEQAEFAMVAFMDEVVSRSSGFGRTQWMANALQLELYGKQEAGEEFFERLTRLRRKGRTLAPALDIFFLCLTLGFKGKYLQEGEEMRRRLIDDLHYELYPQTGQAMQALSPHGLPLGSIFKRKKSWSVWPFTLIILGLGLIVYVVLQFLHMNVEQDILNTLRSSI